MQYRSLALLNGLRIRHCRELWCRSQMCLASGIAVAMAQANSYSSNSTPSPGTYICCGCGSKRKKKKMYRRSQERRDKIFKERPERGVQLKSLRHSEKQFEGLLHHFVYLRNTCAHHSRLWNRKFTKTIAKPRNKPFGLAQQCNFDQTLSADRKLYNSLVFLLYFMDKIAPQHTWRKRLIDLLITHENISKPWMGFPPDWQTYPIWQITQH